MKNIKSLKVALVHEFLTQYGGAERLLEQFRKIFPNSTIYTLIYDPKKMGSYFKDAQIVTSPLQNFPLARPKYKWYLPLMAWATEKLQIPNDVDLIFSDASAFAKGVIAPPRAPHICYLHTPTRYIWSVRDEYLDTAPIPGPIRPFVGPVLDYLKRWDYLAAQRPHYYIVNSQNIANRLLKYYDREADAIVFPFVDMGRFKIVENTKDYFFVLSRLEPAKKTHLAIEACIKLGLKLKVAGSGSLLGEYRHKYGSNDNIEILGRVSDEEIPKLYAEAQAFIFPPEEDAGITPLEAMACGRPVLAFGKGGALETVIPGKTGEFFAEQTVDSLARALKKYDWKSYSKTAIRNHAQQFDVSNFSRSIIKFVQEKINQ